jgi:formamidopyrimidine-DNA glycosylase
MLSIGFCPYTTGAVPHRAMMGAVPELPEVEAARRLASRVARGRRIADLVCTPDPIVFVDPPARVRSTLLGRRVRALTRHGKHLWLELDRRPWPCLHFGMAGGMATPTSAGVRLVSHGKKERPPGWPPRFTKLHLTFDDGGELVVTDARRLGRIRLVSDPIREPPVSLLGFDALLELPARARFAELLQARGAPVKALLLDQTFAAGVGNWIADEVLYQARVAPHRAARSLSPREAEQVRRAIGRVVETAVKAGADSDRYPRAWLFHRRWGRNAHAVTARGERIRHDTIGGRTTAWVPAVQR